MADCPHPAIWFVDLDTSAGDLARARALLSSTEIRQADAYRRPEVRDQYTAAHAALRLIVAPLVGRAPEKLRFDQAACPLCGEPHGRPRLDPTSPDVVGAGPALPHVSLSRRPGLAAVAVAAHPIGVDVEAVDRVIGVDDLAAALHSREKEQLDRLSPDERRATALRFWTRTEAYLKALGTGLGLEPSTVDTTDTLLPTPPGVDLADGTGAGPTDGSRLSWIVHDLTVGSPTHVAAVALAVGRPEPSTPSAAGPPPPAPAPTVHHTTLTDLLTRHPTV